MIRVEKHSEGAYLIEQIDGGVPYGARVVSTANLPPGMLGALFILRFENVGIRVEGTGMRIASDAYELDESCFIRAQDDDEI